MKQLVLLSLNLAPKWTFWVSQEHFGSTTKTLCPTFSELELLWH